MTNAKLFAKLRSLIEDARDADKKHIKKIRKVLHKLKKRQHELVDSLETIESKQELLRVQQEIEVITLQRRKGAEIYKQLKAARKKPKKDDQKGKELPVTPA